MKLNQPNPTKSQLGIYLLSGVAFIAGGYLSGCLPGAAATLPAIAFAMMGKEDIVRQHFPKMLVSSELIISVLACAGAITFYRTGRTHVAWGFAGLATGSFVIGVLSAAKLMGQ